MQSKNDDEVGKGEEEQEAQTKAEEVGEKIYSGTKVFTG